MYPRCFNRGKTKTGSFTLFMSKKQCSVRLHSHTTSVTDSLTSAHSYTQTWTQAPQLPKTVLVPSSLVLSFRI